MANLTEIYPFGKVQAKKMLEDHWLSLPYEDNWFVLPKEKLSETEITLLQQLYPEIGPKDGKKHPWYQFLFAKEPLLQAGFFRVIQIHLQSLPEYSKGPWEETLKEMLQPVDFFYYQPDYVLLIEEQNKKNFSLEELKAVFATLDADFDATTKVYCGNFFHTQEDFPALFKEEQHLFSLEGKRFLKEGFLSLATVALDYLTTDSIQASKIMQSFQMALRSDEELVEIINALLLHQGNISSAAKELFMHRNTLQYRLEKFHEQTGFQLKNITDLTLCALLIHN